MKGGQHRHLRACEAPIRFQSTYTANFAGMQLGHSEKVMVVLRKRSRCIATPVLEDARLGRIIVFPVPPLHKANAIGAEDVFSLSAKDCAKHDLLLPVANHQSSDDQEWPPAKTLTRNIGNGASATPVTPSQPAFALLCSSKCTTSYALST
jgi:hypothetical protein